jgi:hypothetical protein
MATKKTKVTKKPAPKKKSIVRRPGKTGKK